MILVKRAIASIVTSNEFGLSLGTLFKLCIALKKSGVSWVYVSCVVAMCFTWCSTKVAMFSVILPAPLIIGLGGGICLCSLCTLKLH